MRIQKNYEDHTLGFPVILEKAVFKSHGDTWYLDINSRAYQDAVFDLLLEQPMRLSGAQLTFIRKYMDLTQGELAKRVGLEAHGTVSQWEKAGPLPSDMRPVYLQALKVQMAKFRNRQELSVRFLSDILEGKLETKPLIIRAVA